MPTLHPFTHSLLFCLCPELLATWVQLTPEEEWHQTASFTFQTPAATAAPGSFVTLQLRWVFFFCIVFLVFYIIYLKGSIFCTVNFQ